MRLRTYNLIKNIMLGSCAATFYNMSIVESVPVVKEVMATVAVFGMMVTLLSDADKVIFKYKRQARKAEQGEMQKNEKSA